MNKKQILGLIAAGIFPIMALAAGGHDMKGHDMSGMHKEGHAAAFGKPGDPTQVSRTVEVVMDDSMRYTPASIDVKAGETIRFFVKNTGKVPHELMLGTPKDFKAHAEMMHNMPDMQHNMPNMVHLKPGQRGGMVWQFTQAGTFDFACTIPGRMEAGMIGKVVVSQ